VESLNINGIVIKVKQEMRRSTLSEDKLEVICSNIPINQETDAGGFQVLYNQGNLLLEILLKKHIQADNYANDDLWELIKGYSVILVNSALS